MRHSIFKFLLLFSLFAYNSYADIDAQIEAIKQAPVSERFKLMNAFKKNLIKMKEEERIRALKKLTIHTSSKHANKALGEIKNKKQDDKVRRDLESHHIDEEIIINQSTDHEGGDDD